MVGLEAVEAGVTSRSLRWMLAAEALQSLGLVFLQAMLTAAIYGRSGSVLGAAGVGIAAAAGLMAGGLVGAHSLPRGHGLRVVRIGGWLRAALAGGLGAWWAAGASPASPPGIAVGLAFTGLAGAVTSLYDAAIFAVVPQLVPRSQIVRANGMLSVVHQLTRVAGWGLGGLIASWWTPVTLAGLVTAMFVAASLAAGRLSLPGSDPAPPFAASGEPQAGDPGRNRVPLGDGWRILVTSPVARSLTMVDLVEALANAVWTSGFLLAFTVDALGASADWWGLINAGYWTGAMLGTGAAVAFGHMVARRAGSVLWASAVGMALLTIAFTNSRTPWMAALLCVFMGPVYQLREICQATMLQTALPPAAVGGVAAARNALLGPWAMGAAAVMGVVADVLGITAAYAAAAALYGLTALIVRAQPALHGGATARSEAVPKSS